MAGFDECNNPLSLRSYIRIPFNPYPLFYLRYCTLPHDPFEIPECKSPVVTHRVVKIPDHDLCILLFGADLFYRSTGRALSHRAGHSPPACRAVI